VFLVALRCSNSHLQGFLPQLQEGSPDSRQQLATANGMRCDLANHLVKAQAVDGQHSVQALHFCFWQLVSIL